MHPTIARAAADSARRADSGPDGAATGSLRHIGACGAAINRALGGGRLGSRLLGWAATAPRGELPLRPHRAARALGETPERVAEACLLACKLSAMAISWRLLCPGCGGTAGAAESLSGLPARGACRSCGKACRPDLSTNVELTFRTAGWLHAGRSNDAHCGDPEGGRPQGSGPEERMTAQQAFMIQAFRDMAPTMEGAVGSGLPASDVALLLTDLRGSTRLYREIGDARAFALVRKHFRLLHAVVAANRGALLKTMGDGTLSAFDSPAAALRAALDIRPRLRALNEAHDGPDLDLRIAVHVGPCLATLEQGRIDLFGNTVNMADRFLRHSRGDVVVSARAASAPGIPEILAGSAVHAEECIPDGMDASMDFLRLRQGAAPGRAVPPSRRQPAGPSGATPGRPPIHVPRLPRPPPDPRERRAIPRLQSRDRPPRRHSARTAIRRGRSSSGITRRRLTWRRP